MDETIISANLKKIRLQKGLTLQELADRTGLTKGYLSKVERSKKAPPYSTLTKIAAAMGVEVTNILIKDVEPLNDVRICFSRAKNDNIIKETKEISGYDYQVLAAAKPGKNMEPFIIYAPWEIRKLYSHEGEEFMYIMDGTLEFVYGDDTIIMEKGDNVYFDSCVPHSGKSIGDKKAAILTVIYFYKRNRQ
ncbi:MAG: helix-turn-helix transcriptional regulator [Desulfobacteraceae bacterium]|nr:helix-turn-helix transcriptional regulator [Desulfobacteraceae bacterium]